MLTRAARTPRPRHCRADHPAPQRADRAGPGCRPRTPSRGTCTTKALPAGTRDTDTHTRVRHDRIDRSGIVTLRLAGRLHHIGIGRTHARTHARTYVLLLIDDLHVRVIDAVTGELLRELTIDPTRDYQPQANPKTTKPPNP